MKKMKKNDKNAQNPTKNDQKGDQKVVIFDPNLGPLNLNITQFMEKHEKTENLKTIYFCSKNLQKKCNFFLQIF